MKPSVVISSSRSEGTGSGTASAPLSSCGFGERGYEYILDQLAHQPAAVAMPQAYMSVAKCGCAHVRSASVSVCGLNGRGLDELAKTDGPRPLIGSRCGIRTSKPSAWSNDLRLLAQGAILNTPPQKPTRETPLCLRTASACSHRVRARLA